MASRKIVELSGLHFSGCDGIVITLGLFVFLQKGSSQRGFLSRFEPVSLSSFTAVVVEAEAAASFAGFKLHSLVEWRTHLPG